MDSESSDADEGTPTDDRCGRGGIREIKNMLQLFFEKVEEKNDRALTKLQTNIQPGRFVYNKIFYRWTPACNVVSGSLRHRPPGAGPCAVYLPQLLHKIIISIQREVTRVYKSLLEDDDARLYWLESWP